MVRPFWQRWVVTYGCSLRWAGTEPVDDVEYEVGAYLTQRGALLAAEPDERVVRASTWDAEHGTGR